MLCIVIAGMIIIFGRDRLGLEAARFISGYLTLAAFLGLNDVSKGRKKVYELTEYRGKGTINGIKARQIFEDFEVAREKQWWPFWK